MPALHAPAARKNGPPPARRREFAAVCRALGLMGEQGAAASAGGRQQQQQQQQEKEQEEQLQQQRLRWLQASYYPLVSPTGASNNEGAWTPSHLTLLLQSSCAQARILALHPPPAAVAAHLLPAGCVAQLLLNCSRTA